MMRVGAAIPVQNVIERRGAASRDQTHDAAKANVIRTTSAGATLRRKGEEKVRITQSKKNKAGYTATKVACGWAGAIFEVTRTFEQEQ